MEHHVSKIISGLTASQERRGQTTRKPQGDSAKKRQWLDNWLKLDTRPHPTLKELETAIWDFCHGVWTSPTEGRTLLLYGENGTAKTHCARAVRTWIVKVGAAKQWVPEKNVIESLQCIYWHWPELLDRFKNQQWDLLEDCLKIPVLILDELGGGHDPSRVGVDKLCQMLSRREKKWNLLTTNILAESWEETFDRRVASRFMRNCQQIDLSQVPDYNAWLATAFA